jgi:hypothetical protein
MIIWGSKGRKKVISRGVFYCPRCRTQRPYHHVRVSKHFTLYFIPLFETKHLGSYIKCQFCLTPFELSVLTYGQEMVSKVNEFIEAVRQQVGEGIPVSTIFNQLKETGVSDEIANNALAAATNGKLMVCEKCMLIYGGSLKFCSACGAKLSLPV